MPAERHNNRGRIGKASTRGAARETSFRGAATRGSARGGGRTQATLRAKVKELLPDLIRDRRTKEHAETSGSVNESQEKPPQCTQEPQPKTTIAVPARRVERIYNDIWASGPASFAFANHGNLDHDRDTITLALNIMDHIIRPENWNPELSNNKLSASCFFFACKLTGKETTAPRVAGSIWVDPQVVVGMSQADEGPLYDRMLESLTVSAAQVVQGYQILYDQKERLQDLLGEYGEGIAELPSPATEKQLLETDPEDVPFTSQVAAEMIRLGYQRGCGLGNNAEDIEGAGDGEEADTTLCADVSPVVAEVVEEEDAVQLPTAQRDSDDWDDFDIFVADNE